MNNKCKKNTKYNTYKYKEGQRSGETSIRLSNRFEVLCEDMITEESVPQPATEVLCREGRQRQETKVTTGVRHNSVLSEVGMQFPVERGYVKTRKV